VSRLSRFGEIFHGFVFVAFREESEAAIVEEIRIPGLDSQACVEVGQGQIDSPQLQTGAPQVAERIGRSRIKFHHFSKILDRLFVLFNPDVKEPSVVVGILVLPVEFNGL
jgi:hypothetical protein